MPTTLGQLLKDARKSSVVKRRGRSATEVAAAIGVSPSTLGHWEKGNTQPGKAALRRLVNELGVDDETRAEIADAYAWGE